jgi:FkbM family methyltransferase
MKATVDHEVSEPLRTKLDRLLDESVEAAQERERTAFDQAAEPYGRRLVLFGAGNMGRRVLARLRQAGIEPLAFADNSEGSWGKVIDGLTVLRPEEAARRHGENATFVVTIYNNHHNYLDTREQLVAYGCENVVSVVPLRWKYHETFLPYYPDDLPHKVLAQGEPMRKTFSLWADEESRHEYVGQIAWRLHADFDALGVPLPDQQYFPGNMFVPSADECFVDVGAYDGDTVRHFLALRGESFRRIIAIEPDPENFRRLCTYWSTLPPAVRDKIELCPFAVGDRSGRVHFAHGGGPASAISANGAIEVKRLRLDDLLAGHVPTYVKMDIEGAEPTAVEGLRAVLREAEPVLAVCVYHAQDHIWRVPSAIHQIVPSHRLFLRSHGPECRETVCYAVPPERSLAADSAQCLRRPGGMA